MSIHGDQVQLCICIVDIFNMSDLSIWILEDYVSGTNFRVHEEGELMVPNDQNQMND
jgi:hypothetical protein